MDKEKKVMEVMEKENRALTLSEISKLTGINSKEVSKIVKKLKEEGKIFVPKRCYYQVKKER